MKNKLILTSYGLTTKVGRRLIGKALPEYDLSDKKIFLFHEPHYSIEPMLVNACLALGFRKENIILSGQQKNNEEIRNSDIYYITEGNVFEVMSLLRERGLDVVFQKAFEEGSKIYLGASAGAMIAGTSIEEGESFDRNFLRMRDYEGLGLFDGIIIPHYTKAELKKYINSSPEIVNKYTHVLSVANTKSLIMEV